MRLETGDRIVVKRADWKGRLEKKVMSALGQKHMCGAKGDVRFARPPINQNQVELMQIDTVASSKLPGFKELGITPVAVEEVLQEILWDH